MMNNVDMSKPMVVDGKGLGNLVYVLILIAFLFYLASAFFHTIRDPQSVTFVSFIFGLLRFFFPILVFLSLIAYAVPKKYEIDNAGIRITRFFYVKEIPFTDIKKIEYSDWGKYGEAQIILLGTNNKNLLKIHSNRLKENNSILAIRSVLENFSTMYGYTTEEKEPTNTLYTLSKKAGLSKT